MRKKDGLIENYIDDECLILDTSNQKSHHLNQVAVIIWRYLDSIYDLDKLAENLVENFDTNKEEARRDVEQIVQEFIRVGILFAE